MADKRLDLIDRQALIEHLKIHCDGCGEALHCAFEAPTVDAVPVVRCVNCYFLGWRGHTSSGYFYCRHPSGLRVIKDAYTSHCDYGERRKGK